MEISNKHFIIGIDLGTTNCAVSYVDLKSDKKNIIKLFKVPQLTGPGEVTRQSILPSFLYIPGQYDISKDSIIQPWKSDNDNFVGIFARDHGAKIPARLVSSAKSWLCHSKVDRKAKILPWGSSDEVVKISPIMASAYILKHIKNAWNSVYGDDEEQNLENQIVIITVPASFDEVARDLTLDAANLAGLKNVTLIEEPLAAFYSWLISHEENWSEIVKPNELILVCDVGGGTTDFTLITLKDVDGKPRFERIAVGDHLILGGDNIDLALARQIESRLSSKKLSLSIDRWKALCHQCRYGKEVILDNEAEFKKITLMGEGGKLIAGTLSATLERKSVEDTVLEGFFPLVDMESSKKRMSPKGITEFGLPYEQEPAITRHLGWFLENHKQDVANILNKERYLPDFILFNGGSLKPNLIQERIRQAIRFWFKEQDENIPKLLDNREPDLAVAIGASYYGLVKIGKGQRVGSGSPRAYFLGVSKKDENDKNYAICIIERGLEEGSNIELKDKNFEVLTNQPVTFDIYSSSYRSGDKSGNLIIVDNSLTSLAPIQTIVQYGKKSSKTNIPVHIEATYTEVGTLSIWCRSLISNHRWQFQFQLRDSSSLFDISDSTFYEESIIEDVNIKVKDVFLNPKSDIDSLETLVKEISRIVGTPKEKWPIGLIRNISDTLISIIDIRKESPDYESRWLNIAGFCLRPGFGDALDELRIKKLWKVYMQGLSFPNYPQVRSEWWIMLRRIAGGLTAGQQRQFSQEVTNIMLSKKGSKIKISNQERIELWMAIANMERLSVKDKIKWGQLLISEIDSKKAKPQELWSLSRIGARDLLYGPVDRVIPQQEISLWIDKIISQIWNNPKPILNAIIQLARKTGDRMRDLSPAMIEKIINWMSQFAITNESKKYFIDIVPIEKQEKNVIFGESLPSGIIFSQMT